MTCLVDHDVCNGLNPMDKCCHDFSAGKLLVVFCLSEILAEPQH